MRNESLLHYCTLFIASNILYIFDKEERDTLYKTLQRLLTLVNDATRPGIMLLITIQSCHLNYKKIR